MLIVVQLWSGEKAEQEHIQQRLLQNKFCTERLVVF